jgi:hypothetical protein|tara:strand:- start:4257 stop:4487 length:231 start_codon:yes stop_codon:yes gene_type:complete
MDSSLVVDMWSTFKDSIDKKTIESTAETFVDTCADYGADDQCFRDALGSCDILDQAINYYLDLEEDVDDDADDWED